MTESGLTAVIGTWATPGGWVRLQGLRDGWIVSPDHAAPRRRWGIWGGLLVIFSLPVAWGLSRIDPDTGGLIGFLVVIGALLVAIVGRNVAGIVGSVRNVRQLRADAGRAGGAGSMLRGWLVGVRDGRESTSDDAAGTLERVGSDDGVVRAGKVRRAWLRQRRFRTSVRIELADGNEISYRASGPFQAPRMARIMRTALGAKCVDGSAVADVDSPSA